MAGVFDFMKGENQVGKSGLLGSMEPNDTQALALLQAMGPIQQAGLQRTATPLGSIAQNLLPIFGAMIYAKAAEKQAAQQQEAQQIENMKNQAALAESLSKIDPEKRQALLDKIKAETELVRTRERMAGDPRANLPANVRAEMAAPNNPEIAAALAREDQRVISRGVAIEQAKTRSDQQATEALLARFGIKPPSVGNPPAGSGGGAPSPEIIGQAGPAYGAPSFSIEGGKIKVGISPEKPPKPSAQESAVGEQAQTVAGMRPLAERALETGYGGQPMPDVLPGIQYKANAYLAGKKSTEGGVSNFFAQQVYGNPDPRLDDYFSKIGQMEAATLSAANTMSSRGGKYVMEEITKHSVHLGNQPGQNRTALKNLYDPNGLVAQRVLPEIPKLLKSGDMSVQDVGIIFHTFDLLERDSSGKRKIAVDQNGNVIGKGINGKTYALPPEAAGWRD